MKPIILTHPSRSRPLKQDPRSSDSYFTITVAIRFAFRRIEAGLCCGRKHWRIEKREAIVAEVERKIVPVDRLLEGMAKLSKTKREN